MINPSEACMACSHEMGEHEGMCWVGVHSGKPCGCPGVRPSDVPESVMTALVKANGAMTPKLAVALIDAGWVPPSIRVEP